LSDTSATMLQPGKSSQSTFSHNALLRLLAINLAAGAAAALLLVGGLLLLNPAGLRDLILADRSPAIALGVLVMSFFVTFGSMAMGSAIMTTGPSRDDDEDPRGGRRRLVAPAPVRTERP
jgi:hypothetical protein